ncbi:hypothetical protein BIT28_03385 [Photobacterium proteolyticum]|uniref:Uncharacterized protein n=1 Tax=Photobacterium proteolyticum TaxID=1903952 RepID=A0A1Q9GA55_9GAMM|nr:hypothetical protein [Photobacterium proteolyticum]OLQ71222.1 hypothetical protein BIT28_03385 [Photobacterium proteolyticum]
MENQQDTVTSPIHRPCPDMPGTANFNAELTKRSAKIVHSLREKFGLTTGCSTAGGKDFRFSRTYQVQARRAQMALMAKGGVL